MKPLSEHAQIILAILAVLVVAAFLLSLNAAVLQGVPLRQLAYTLIQGICAIVIVLCILEAIRAIHKKWDLSRVPSSTVHSEPSNGAGSTPSAPSSPPRFQAVSHLVDLGGAETYLEAWLLLYADLVRRLENREGGVTLMALEQTCWIQENTSGPNGPYSPRVWTFYDARDRAYDFGWEGPRTSQ